MMPDTFMQKKTQQYIASIALFLCWLIIFSPIYTVEALKIDFNPSTGVQTTETTANISWTTDKEAAGILRYGIGSPTEQIIRDPAASHSVLLEGLTPNTDYVFEIVATLGAEADKVSDQSFYTGVKPAATAADLESDSDSVYDSVTVSDSVLPVTGLAAPEVKADSVRIVWDISDNTGIDHYKIYRNGAVLIEDIKTKFYVDSDSIVAGKTYDYEVSAVDAVGNEGPRTSVSATPGGSAQGIIISDVSAEVIGTNVLITWKSDLPGHSKVKYGENSLILDKFEEMPVIGLEHNISIKNLKKNTTYTFIVQSCDRAGICGNSSAETFTTTEQQELFLNVDNFDCKEETFAYHKSNVIEVSGVSSLGADVTAFMNDKKVRFKRITSDGHFKFSGIRLDAKKDFNELRIQADDRVVKSIDCKEKIKFDYYSPEVHFSNKTQNLTVSTTPNVEIAGTLSDEHDVTMYIYSQSLDDTTPPGQVTNVTNTSVDKNSLTIEWQAPPPVSSTTGSVTADTTSFLGQDAGNIASETLNNIGGSLSGFATAVTGNQASNTTAAVSTPDPDIFMYLIYRSDVADGPIATVKDKTSFTDTNVSTKTTYTYQVSAMDNAGNKGPKSAPFSITTLENGTVVGPRNKIVPENPSLKMTKEFSPNNKTTDFKFNIGPLNDGRNKVRVLVVDVAGNEFEESFDVTLDTEPPKILAPTAADLTGFYSPSFVSEINIHGQINKEDGQVWVYVNQGTSGNASGDPVSKVNVEANGTFDAEVTLATTIAAIASGSAGSTSASSGVGTVSSKGTPTKVTLVAVDAYGRKSSPVEGSIIYTPCGEGNYFQVKIKPGGNVMNTREIMEGIAAYGFGYELKWQGGFGDAKNVTVSSVTITKATVGKEFAKNYDFDWMAGSGAQVTSKPNNRSYGFALITFKPQPAAGNETYYAKEKNLSSHRHNQCFPGAGCVNLLLQMDIQFSSPELQKRYNQMNQGNIAGTVAAPNHQKQCVKLQIQLDKRLDPSVIPKSMLRETLKAINATLEFIEMIKKPLEYVTKIVLGFCMLSFISKFAVSALRSYYCKTTGTLSSLAKGSGAIGSIIKSGQMEKIARFDDGTEEGACTVEFSEGDKGKEAVDACKSCAQWIDKERYLTDKWHLFCDRITCPPVPSLQYYIIQKYGSSKKFSLWRAAAEATQNVVKAKCKTNEILMSTECTCGDKDCTAGKMCTSDSRCIAIPQCQEGTVSSVYCNCLSSGKVARLCAPGQKCEKALCIGTQEKAVESVATPASSIIREIDKACAAKKPTWRCTCENEADMKSRGYKKNENYIKDLCGRGNPYICCMPESEFKASQATPSTSTLKTAKWIENEVGTVYSDASTAGGKVQMDSANNLVWRYSTQSGNPVVASKVIKNSRSGKWMAIQASGKQFECECPSYAEALKVLSGQMSTECKKTKNCGKSNADACKSCPLMGDIPAADAEKCAKEGGTGWTCTCTTNQIKKLGIKSTDYKSGKCPTMPAEIKCCSPSAVSKITGAAVSGYDYPLPDLSDVPQDSGSNLITGFSVGNEVTGMDIYEQYSFACSSCKSPSQLKTECPKGDKACLDKAIGKSGTVSNLDQAIDDTELAADTDTLTDEEKKFMDSDAAGKTGTNNNKKTPPKTETKKVTKPNYTKDLLPYKKGDYKNPNQAKAKSDCEFAQLSRDDVAKMWEVYKKKDNTYKELADACAKGHKYQPQCCIFEYMQDWQWGMMFGNEAKLSYCLSNPEGEDCKKGSNIVNGVTGICTAPSSAKKTRPVELSEIKFKKDFPIIDIHKLDNRVIMMVDIDDSGSATSARLGYYSKSQVKGTTGERGKDGSIFMNTGSAWTPLRSGGDLAADLPKRDNADPSKDEESYKQSFTAFSKEICKYVTAKNIVDRPGHTVSKECAKAQAGDFKNAKQMDEMFRRVYNLVGEPHRQFLAQPTSSMMDTFLTLCLTTLSAWLDTVRNFLELAQDCLQTVLITGDGSAGQCRAWLSQYICDLIQKAISCIMQRSGSGAGSRVGSGGISGIFGAIHQGSASVMAEANSRYNKNNLFSTTVGATNLVHDSCVFFFTGEWPTDYRSIFETAISQPINSTAWIGPFTRRWQAYDGTTGYARFVYHVSYMISAGANIHYDVYLKCSGTEKKCPLGEVCDCGHTGLDYSKRSAKIIVPPHQSGTCPTDGELKKGAKCTDEILFVLEAPQGALRYDQAVLEWRPSTVTTQQQTSQGKPVFQGTVISAETISGAAKTDVEEIGPPPQGLCSFSTADIAFRCGVKIPPHGRAVIVQAETTRKGTAEYYQPGDKAIANVIVSNTLPEGATTCSDQCQYTKYLVINKVVNHNNIQIYPPQGTNIAGEKINKQGVTTFKVFDPEQFPQTITAARGAFEIKREQFSTTTQAGIPCQYGGGYFSGAAPGQPICTGAPEGSIQVTCDAKGTDWITNCRYATGTRRSQDRAFIVTGGETICDPQPPDTAPKTPFTIKCHGITITFNPGLLQSKVKDYAKLSAANKKKSQNHFGIIIDHERTTSTGASGFTCDTTPKTWTMYVQLREAVEAGGGYKMATGPLIDPDTNERQEKQIKFQVVCQGTGLSSQGKTLESLATFTAKVIHNNTEGNKNRGLWVESGTLGPAEYITAGSFHWKDANQKHLGFELTINAEVEKPAILWLDVGAIGLIPGDQTTISKQGSGPLKSCDTTGDVPPCTKFLGTANKRQLAIMLQKGDPVFEFYGFSQAQGISTLIGKTFTLSKDKCTANKVTISQLPTSQPEIKVEFSDYQEFDDKFSIKYKTDPLSLLGPFTLSFDLKDTFVPSSNIQVFQDGTEIPKCQGAVSPTGAAIVSGPVPNIPILQPSMPNLITGFGSKTPTKSSKSKKDATPTGPCATPVFVGTRGGGDCWVGDVNKVGVMTMGGSHNIVVKGISKIAKSSAASIKDAGLNKIILTYERPKLYGVEATGLRPDGKVIIQVRSPITTKGQDIRMNIEVTQPGDENGERVLLTMNMNPMGSLAGSGTQITESTPGGPLVDCTAAEGKAQSCVSLRSQDRLSFMLPKISPGKDFLITGLGKTEGKQALCEKVPYEEARKGSRQCGVNMYCYAPPVTGVATTCMSQCKIDYIQTEYGKGQSTTGTYESEMFKDAASFNKWVSSSESGFCINSRDTCQFPVLYQNKCPSAKVCCLDGSGVSKKSSKSSSGSGKRISSLENYKISGDGVKCGPQRKVAYEISEAAYNEAFKKSGGQIIGNTRQPNLAKGVIYYMGNCKSTEFCKKDGGSVTSLLKAAKGGVVGPNVPFEASTYECVSKAQKCESFQNIDFCKLTKKSGTSSVGTSVYNWKSGVYKVLGKVGWKIEQFFGVIAGSSSDVSTSASVECTCTKKNSDDCKIDACKLKVPDLVAAGRISGTGFGLTYSDLKQGSTSGSTVKYTMNLGIVVQPIQPGEKCLNTHAVGDPSKCLCKPSSGQVSSLTFVDVGDECPQMCSSSYAEAGKKCFCQHLGGLWKVVDDKTKCCQKFGAQYFIIPKWWASNFNCQVCQNSIDYCQKYGGLSDSIKVKACNDDPCQVALGMPGMKCKWNAEKSLCEPKIIGT